MRNYIMIEKTKEGGIFLSQGKGTDTAVDYDEKKDWKAWERMESKDELFARIIKLMY